MLSKLFICVTLLASVCYAKIYRVKVLKEEGISIYTKPRSIGIPKYKCQLGDPTYHLDEGKEITIKCKQDPMKVEKGIFRIIVKSKTEDFALERVGRRKTPPPPPASPETTPRDRLKDFQKEFGIGQKRTIVGRKLGSVEMAIKKRLKEWRTQFERLTKHKTRSLSGLSSLEIQRFIQESQPKQSYVELSAMIELKSLYWFQTLKNGAELKGEALEYYIKMLSKHFRRLSKQRQMNQK